jgi:lysozyme
MFYRRGAEDAGSRLERSSFSSRIAVVMKNKFDRKSVITILGSLVLVTAGIGGGLFYFGKIHINHPSRSQFPIRGIDISSYQKNIDWNRIDPSEINFVLIKATEGGDFKDPMFKSNWENVRERKLVSGAYHFFTFCKSGQEQAKNYIDTVPVAKYTLPPVIDLEFIGNCNKKLTSTELDRELQSFIDLVAARYDRQPLLYTTNEFYNAYLRGKYPSIPIWISDFYSFNRTPTLPDGKAWTFWQYTERGTVSGIDGLVDLDVFNGTPAQFEKLVNP